MGYKIAAYITVFVLVIAMTITLLVFWNLYIIGDYHTIRELSRDAPRSEARWTVLILGIVFFSVILIVLSVFFTNLLRGARFKKQQKDFVNMVTHELKLPMSSIRMFAQTLRQRTVSEEERLRFLDLILDGCDRMNLLLEHLLKSQQIEQGRMPIEKRRVKVSQFLGEFVLRWPRPLQIEPPPAEYEGWSAVFDPVLLEFALTNLVINAEKYGRGKPPSIAVEAEGHKLRFHVRDEAQPIPLRYRRRIFRKFYRIPNRETRRQNGAGLGLYIVRTIMRMHKGEVWVSEADSPPGNRFTLSLPCLD